MDFILSLTHFCEVHGPKSVLCTQVLPVECARCLSQSPVLHPRPSNESLATQVHDPPSLDRSSRPPTLRKSDTTSSSTLTTDLSAASTTVESEPSSPTIEAHSDFVGSNKTIDPPKHFRFGRAQGDTCASCSFSVPQTIADQLPAGAPGSTKTDGKGKNGSPVLRSREFVCMGETEHSTTDTKDNFTPHTHMINAGSNASSFRSSVSADSNCHDHLLTYLTSRSPDDPEAFSLLRASVIRTLSCEHLPRGMSDGPFCFGDSVNGYTIAYVFRLTDPKARGRRRAYAFVALAGNDANRAFRACPMIWEAFATLARAIENAAQKCQDKQMRKEEDERESNKCRNYTPVTSFLTQRAVDPDGYPRRAGQVSPRSLAEIVGDENIFAVLHQYFVAILQCLGKRFGRSVHDMPSIDQAPPNKRNSEVIGGIDRLEENGFISSAARRENLEAAMAKMNLSTHPTNPNHLCAPLNLNQTGSPQIVA